MAQIKQVIE
jgi:hypothetical protein